MWELRDPEGKLPLDAFDEINEHMDKEDPDDAGRVYSPSKDHWFTWEVMNPDDTEPVESPSLCSQCGLEGCVDSSCGMFNSDTTE